MGESIPRKGITKPEVRRLLDVFQGKQRVQCGWVELAWKRERRWHPDPEGLCKDFGFYSELN